VDLELIDELKPEPSFATEMGKTFLLSAVATAGTFAGLVAFGYVAAWIKLRQEKKLKENEVTETK
jgi:hypothetical protein